MWKGPRGGHYFKGPKKRRYDPKRFARIRRYGHRVRGFGGKLEGGVNKYGGFLGFFGNLAYGIYHGFTEYQTVYGASAGVNYLHTITGGDIYDSAGTKIGTRTPEISKLWGTSDSTWGGGIDKYLKYKFLGLDADNKYIGSSWSPGIIGGLIATFAGPIAKLFTSKGQRILRPLSKIGQGLLASSTAGALALPGSGENVSKTNMTRTPNGTFVPVPPNPNNNQIKGAF